MVAGIFGMVGRMANHGNEVHFFAVTVSYRYRDLRGKGFGLARMPLGV